VNKAEIKNLYSHGLNFLPRHMHEGIRFYVDHGRATGGFLTSLLDGDLDGAFMRADPTNLAHRKEWLTFLSEYLPEQCHGSRTKAEAWRKMGGLAGLPAEGTGNGPA